MFDLFDFTPVDYDPFEKETKPTSPASPPARPYSPTPDPIDALLNKLYPQDLPTHWAKPDPLPSWLPPDAQSYINQTPSFNEGERMPPSSPIVGESGAPEQQIADIKRLFRNRIIQNTPTGEGHGLSADQYRALMRLPGFTGFTGGEEI